MSKVSRGRTGILNARLTDKEVHTQLPATQPTSRIDLQQAGSSTAGPAKRLLCLSRMHLDRQGVGPAIMVEGLADIARDAGRLVMEIYNSDPIVRSAA